ncbi:reverse transcriptase domain-containing protein [Lactobacillus crispatus]|uniref:reverse transcriptase domain-containing protein n=1 Tax=Lactobacillus crispatus TaxID=47770 RepID=UPI0015E08B4A|nr:reverse transcriptase domain-containing protein [Lactobacillus crispatus]
MATVVYLNDSDNRLVDYLTNNLNIADFKIVRYVDDLYIFSNEFDIRSFHKIRNKYSSYLKKEDLAINSEKTKFLRSDELENEIKTSFYGEDQIEIVDDSDLNLNNIGDRFLQFLKSLNDLLADNELDYKEYKKIRVVLVKSF